MGASFNLLKKADKLMTESTLQCIGVSFIDYWFDIAEDHNRKHIARSRRVQKNLNLVTYFPLMRLNIRIFGEDDTR